MPEGPGQIPDPATHYGLHVDVLGQLQGVVLPHVVEDAAGQDKPPCLVFWQEDRLLLLAHGAVVGIGGPILGSKYSHILGAEVWVEYSPLLTAQMAIAVLMLGLIQLLPQSLHVPG